MQSRNRVNDGFVPMSLDNALSAIHQVLTLIGRKNLNFSAAGFSCLGVRGNNNY